MTQLLRTYRVRSLRRHALMRGAASAFDLRGNTKRQFHLAPTPAQADADAILDDWQAVGADLQQALQAYAPR